MADNKMTAEQALERFRQDLLPDPHDERDIDASWIRRRWEKYEPIIRQALSAPRVPGGWVPIDDKLPEIGQLVALMDTGRYANMPDGLPDMHVTAVGFLNEFGRKYWSVFGSAPAACLDGFTHWMALPNVLTASPEPVAPAHPDEIAVDRFAEANEFERDWSMLEATQDSLREHSKLLKQRDSELADLRAELKELRAKYTELLYQVHEKVDGQSRHETALARLSAHNKTDSSGDDAEEETHS